MADRYQNRSNPTASAYAQDPRAQSEGDPLAELARLIGQTDPFASNARGQQPRRAEPAQAYHEEPEDEPGPAPSPPSWMQRVAQQRAQQVEPQYAPPAEPSFDDHQDYQQPQHDAQAYAASGYAPQGYAAQGYAAQDYPAQDYAAQDYAPQGAYAQPQQGYDQHNDHAGHDAYGHAELPHAASYQPQDHLDPGRYDDALYGQADVAHGGYQQEQYQDDPYAYPHAGYAEEEAPKPKRRGGLATVAAVLALAVVGTGGAFAYRTFIGSSRSGEPPVIKADPGPNKIVPPSATASSDSGKAMDRLASGQERMISREEQPVNVEDASKAGGPRVVFPPLNQNANPPTTASVSPANKPMVASNAAQGDQPRRIPTIVVRGDQPDASATPASRQTPSRLNTPTSNIAPANAPMSLAPQAPPTAAPAARTAALNTAPQDITPAPATSGGYVVQVSSQRSDSDARASFKALQNKFPSVLGSWSPLIKRADLGEKGTYYRAMVGPFGTPDEASQLCGNLKSAGGQCVVQRN